MWRPLAALCLALTLTIAAGSFLESKRPESLKVTVLRQLEHTSKPFTQGLEYDDDKDELVETSGSFPPGVASYIRGIDPQTGGTKWTSKDGFNGAFAEGIAQVPRGGNWFVSLYKEPRRTLEYDKDLKYVADHPYYFDGWGLTRNTDGKTFLATNGSSYVMTLEPDTFKLLGGRHARCLGKNVPALNELELVDDFLGRGKPALLGNVYTSRVVLALDPETMGCIAAFHLDDVAESHERGENVGFHVANGIAYNKKTDSFFVTGKNWNSMFEIKLGPHDLDEDASLASMSHGNVKGDAVDKLKDCLAEEHTAPGILSLAQLYGQAAPDGAFELEARRVSRTA